MKVSNTRCQQVPSSDGRLRISVLVEYDDRPGEPEDYWFELPAARYDESTGLGTPWLALLLPLACHLNQRLVIDDPVDARVLEGANEIMRIWNCWHPDSHIIQIEAPVGAPGPQRSNRTGSFFSGGVDSFYSAISHDREGTPGTPVDDLIVLLGFDIPITDAVQIANARESLGNAAAELGKPLLEIATNVRQRRAESLPWGLRLHGPVLAAAGLCLAQTHSRIYIPSSYTYKKLVPWGSHALIDPLWSTSSLHFHYDGAQYSRIEKLRRILDSPAAMKYLRVCWQDTMARNCMKCDKCFRTMIALEVLGAREKCTALDVNAFSLERLATRIVDDECEITNMETVLDSVDRHARPDLSRALAAGIALNKRHILHRQLFERLEMTPLVGWLFGWIKREIVLAR